jgi:ADP-heptose:LPS heptosyltransferase
VALSERPALLVLRALGLGDFLTAVPAYRALAAAFPEHDRLLAAPAALAPLLPLVPGFARLLPSEPLVPLHQAPPRVDTAVNLHGRGPQSHRILLELRPRRLIAFAHSDVPESIGGPPWSDAEHEVARWCRLLQSEGIPASPEQLDIARPQLRAGQRSGYTLIHPGAASPARRWPLERWAAVARGELEHGRSVLLSAGPGERERVTELAQLSGLQPSACAGDQDLHGLAERVARAGLVLCADTGVAHLATALRTPSVVLFGPTSPARWGPPDRPWHRVLWAGREGDPHAAAPDPGLLQIAVSDVQAQIAALRRSVAHRGAAARGADVLRSGAARS